MRDASGASVPGATVIIHNEKTGEERTTVSGKDGSYSIGPLKPSVYTIRAAAGEFAPTEYTGLQLLPAQELTIDLELRP